ncbi:MAG TPA: hypothetical protein VK925_00165, partial [Jiangellaceae bacterium]|nr:hypothetical protein [Jiangellaceae bacterium]
MSSATLVRLADVPQRAGQLDHRPAAPLAGQLVLQGLPVQRNGEVGTAGRVVGACPLEQPGRIVRRQLGGQRVDPRPQLCRVLLAVEQRPHVCHSLLPVRIAHRPDGSNSHPEG